MWLKSLQSIRDVLDQLKVADEVKLGGYMPSQVRTDYKGKGCIYLLRDRETTEGYDLVEDAEISIFLDAWVYNTSSKLEDGYIEINALEKRIDYALQSYKETTDYIDKGLQFMGLEVREKTGDLDSVRPMIGVRYHIIINVYKQEG